MSDRSKNRKIRKIYVLKDLSYNDVEDSDNSLNRNKNCMYVCY